jgi:hypothetical protein
MRAPDRWHWPVGASVSMEFGYQRRAFSPDTCTLELRPIIVKGVGRWYLSTNAALERSFHGESVPMGFTFAPAGKIGYDFSRTVSAGVEYYASYSKLLSPDTLHNQQQQIFAVKDLNVSQQWGGQFWHWRGTDLCNRSSDPQGILGRHFDWTHHR